MSLSSSCVLCGGAISMVALSIAACNYGPPAVKQPSIDASDAGDLAMEQYDTNGDGRVAGEELEKAPGLKAALPRMDADADGAVTADEVAARIGQWKKMGIGLMSFGFTVTLNGSPLPDATVTFEPELFLGDDIKLATCTTNPFGSGSATIAKEDRPDPSYPPGMQLGLYKVKISKMDGGKEIIPARYNEATVLGQEVAQDVSEIASQRVVYALKTP
jgi:hypothetical protein